MCPHNFKKLEDDGDCTPYGRRTPPYKKRVCCLLGPVLDLQVCIFTVSLLLENDTEGKDNC